LASDSAMEREDAEVKGASSPNVEAGLFDIEAMAPLGPNPIKRLLEFFAAEKGLDALDFYRAVLEDSLGLTSSLQAVSILNHSNILRFYGKKNEEPRYLSIRKHATLVKLCNLVRRDMVILQLFPHNTRTLPLKVFDSRLQQKVMGGGERRRTEFFCIVYREDKDAYQTYHVSNPHFICPNGLSVLEDCFMECGNSNFREQPCHLERLAGLIGRTVCRDSSSEIPWSLLDLCLRSSEACTLLGGGVTVILAYHLGSLPVKGTWSRKKRNNPERQTFRILSVIRDSSKRIDWEGARVIGITAEGRLYIVRQKHAKAIATKRRLMARDANVPAHERDGPLPRDMARPSDKPGEDAERGRSRARPAPESRGSSSRRRRRRQEVPPHRLPLSPCNCKTCKGAEKFRPNLSPIGPQRLYKVPFDVEFYLKLLDLETQANSEAIASAVRLSYMALDVESCTVSTDSASSRKFGRTPSPEPVASAGQATAEGTSSVDQDAAISLEALSLKPGASSAPSSSSSMGRESPSLESLRDWSAGGDGVSEPERNRSSCNPRRPYELRTSSSSSSDSSDGLDGEDEELGSLFGGDGEEAGASDATGGRPETSRRSNLFPSLPPSSVEPSSGTVGGITDSIGSTSSSNGTDDRGGEGGAQTPPPGISARQEDDDDGDYIGWRRNGQEDRQRVPFEHLSSVPRADPSGEDVVALQRPIVIGHLDNIGDNPEPHFFEVEGGLAGVQDAVHRYLHHVLEAKERAAKAKREILKPLLDYCASYFEAHQRFFAERQIDDKTCLTVWRRTHLGLFQVELERLINNVYIFTFNGAGGSLRLF
jgi:hypothetical protein